MKRILVIKINKITRLVCFDTIKVNCFSFNKRNLLCLRFSRLWEGSPVHDYPERSCQEEAYWKGLYKLLTSHLLKDCFGYDSVRSLLPALVFRAYCSSV